MRKLFVLMSFVFVFSLLLVLPVGVRADDVNRAPMFQYGVENNFWGWANSNGGNGYYGSTLVAYKDDSVLSPNGFSSFRLIPLVHDETHTAGEMDFNWLYVEPNDHIVYSCWIKTGSASLVEGARIGFDLYANGGNDWVDGAPNGDITGMECVFGEAPQNTDVPFTITSYWESGTGELHGWNVSFIGWGHDWIQMKWDFIVPDKVYTKGGYDQHSIVPSQITHLACWLDDRCGSTSNWDTGNYPDAWFADAELYINPSGSPIPTPTATPTGSAVPSGGVVDVSGLDGLGVVIVPVATMSMIGSLVGVIGKFGKGFNG